MSYFAVGSYTERAPHVPEAAGKGIYLIELDHETGETRLAATLGGVINPSYLAWDAAESRLFSITESIHDAGAVAAFRLTREKGLETINSVVGPGKSNCHILHLPERNQLFAASYSEGRLKGYAVRQGRIAAEICDIRYAGSGPIADRQERPHAHQTLPTPGGSGLVVTDLGSDTVWFHDLDELEAPPRPFCTVPGGYGPRHMVFDSDGVHAYLLCELKPRLLVLRLAEDGRSAEIIADHDTIPETPGARCAPAAVKLHPSGKSVAVSNRFVDTLALFTIDRASGTVELRHAASLPSGGKTPRDIEFSSDGRWLLAANQDSSILASIPFDPASGLPAGGEAFSLVLGTPVCAVELG